MRYDYAYWGKKSHVLISVLFFPACLLHIIVSVTTLLSTSSKGSNNNSAEFIPDFQHAAVDFCLEILYVYFSPFSIHIGRETWHYTR